MTRRKWAEAKVYDLGAYAPSWMAIVTVRGNTKMYRRYSHRRSAKRAAIQWAKKHGYELRWV